MWGESSTAIRDKCGVKTAQQQDESGVKTAQQLDESGVQLLRPLAGPALRLPARPLPAGKKGGRRGRGRARRQWKVASPPCRPSLVVSWSRGLLKTSSAAVRASPSSSPNCFLCPLDCPRLDLRDEHQHAASGADGTAVNDPSCLCWKLPASGLGP